MPALERLLYGKSDAQHLAQFSDTPDCQVVVAIADNLHAMAVALNQGWQDYSAVVQSMVQPESGADHFITDDEILRSLVTQIIVAIDVVLDCKIAALTDDKNKLADEAQSLLRTLTAVAGGIKVT